MIIKNIAVLLAAILIIACGGGGGGGSDNTDNNNTPNSQNSAPVVDAGFDQNAYVGSTIYLNAGNSHDPDGDPITYTWVFIEIPENSRATISGLNQANATFIADVQGTYLVSLTVSDGLLESDASTITIEVEQQVQAWTHTNGPEGGRVTCTISDKSGNLYAGTGAGIYKSIDNGSTWTGNLNTLPGTSIISMVVTDDDELLLGTNS